MNKGYMTLSRFTWPRKKTQREAICQILIEYLNAPEKRIRKAACEILGWLGWPKDSSSTGALIETLWEKLTDPCEKVSQEAWFSLMLMGKPEDEIHGKKPRDHETGELEKDDGEKLLSSIRRAIAVPPSEEKLQGLLLFMRRCELKYYPSETILKALGLDEKELKRPLEEEPEKRKESADDLLEFVKEACEEIESMDASAQKEFIKSLIWPDEIEKRQKLLDKLLQQLKSHNPRERFFASNKLLVLGWPPHIKEKKKLFKGLLPHLYDEDELTRDLVRSIFSKRGWDVDKAFQKKLILALRKCLQHEDESVIEDACRLLEDISSWIDKKNKQKIHKDLLTMSKEHPSPYIAQVAWWTLDKLGLPKPEPQEEDDEVESKVTSLVHRIILEGQDRGAEVTYCRPHAECLAVWHKVQGSWQKGLVIPGSLKRRLVERVKILSLLDIIEKFRMQQGFIHISIKDKNASKCIHYWVLTDPCRFGEKIALRPLYEEQEQKQDDK